MHIKAMISVMAASTILLLGACSQEDVDEAKSAAGDAIDSASEMAGGAMDKAGEMASGAVDTAGEMADGRAGRPADHLQR